MGPKDVFNDDDLKLTYKEEFGSDLDDETYLSSFKFVYDIIRIRFSTKFNGAQKEVLIKYVGKLYKGTGRLLDAYSAIYSATNRNAGLNQMLNLHYDLEDDDDIMDKKLTELGKYLDYIKHQI